MALALLKSKILGGIPICYITRHEISKNNNFETITISLTGQTNTGEDT